jgi:hypothetical protein
MILSSTDYLLGQSSKIKVALYHRNYGSNFVGQLALPRQNNHIEEMNLFNHITTGAVKPLRL